MADDLPDWYNRPPLSPTERLRVYPPSPAQTPSQILGGPSYDVRAHYARVKTLYDAYPYKDDDRCDFFTGLVIRLILGRLERKPTTAIISVIRQTAQRLFSAEGFYRPDFEHQIENPPSSMWINLIVRPTLIRQEGFFKNLNDRIEQAGDALVDLCTILLKHAPDGAFVEEKKTNLVSLIYLMPRPRDLIDHVVSYIYSAKSEGDKTDLFPATARQLLKNVYTASGYTPESIETTKSPKLVLPADSDLPLSECVLAYLNDTPFSDILLMPLPFVIPEKTRSEHTVIVAASGAGKTQLLQDKVLEDLNKPDPPGMVIIDPKGLMVERIRKLDLFHPDTGRLRDRLIILDPIDVPALNMFSLPPYAAFSDTQRNRIINQLIETFGYIFSSSDARLTQRQSVPFSFVVQLIFSMGGDINTLMDVLEDDAKAPRFTADIKKLAARSDAARRFFEKDFYTGAFGETRQQIKTRIYEILARPELVAMFNAPCCNIDIFDCIQKRKILLVNTGMSQLGTKGSQLFGRYIIAMTLNAAFARASLPKDQWHFASLVIDEFLEFVDEDKTPELLRLTREYNVGVTMALQDMHTKPMNDAIRTAISTNTSSKYAASVEGIDLNYVARDLRCEPEFIRAQGKDGADPPKWGQFACFVRNLGIDHAVSVTIPFLTLENLPRMNDQAHAKLLDQNRKLVCSIAEPIHSAAPNAAKPPTDNSPEPAPQTAEPDSQSQALKPATEAATSKPVRDANHPQTGDHTEPASKWGNQ